MSRGSSEKPVGSRKPYRFVSSQEFIPWTRNPQADGQAQAETEEAEGVQAVRGERLVLQQEPDVRAVPEARESKSRVAQAIRDLGGKATAQGIASHLKDAPSSVSAKIASLVRSGIVEKCGETLVTVRRFNGETQVTASVWRLK